MPKPKYQIGDEVWVLARRKIEKAKVTVIHASINKLGTSLFYYAETISSEGNTSVEGAFEESDLFPTKEELLASL